MQAAADETLLPGHGGLLFPFDMFRPKMLAGALGEALVAKVRNIVDARLVLTCSLETQLVLARIEGSVVEDDPANFWRQNIDLLMVASQVFPRQMFAYYVYQQPERREGFMVAQRGQPLAADDSDQDGLEVDDPQKRWPVTLMCEQMQLSMDELEAGFAGSPSIELSLLEPEGDDRELLMALAGRGPETEDPEPQAGRAQRPSARPQGQAPAQANPQAKQAKPRKVTVEQDQRRRDAEKAAELQALSELAARTSQDLPFVIDEAGVVAAPRGVELSDAKVLSRYHTPAIAGNLPEGLPRELHDKLQGRAVDFAVSVEFLSEVFVDNQPLSGPVFRERAQATTVGGHELLALEVLAPRLGAGTLYAKDRSRVFVSRKRDQPAPEKMLLELLGLT